MKNILENKADLAALLLRLTVGIVIFAHGAQKLFGWFGGYGFNGTMGYFTETVGLPYIVGFLVIIGESIGMIALAFGLLTRFSALSLIIIMGGAFFIDHLPHAAAVAVLGAGRYSVDAWVSKLRMEGLKQKGEGIRQKVNV
jgi:putative oxidoreductase